MPIITGNPSHSDDKPHDHDYTRVFRCFGVEFHASGSGQARAEECPFCGGTKFYVDVKTGQYKCQSGSCGKSGNAMTFINWVHETFLGETTDADYHRLRDTRELPLQTLKRHELAWYGAKGCWLIPYKSETGKVQNVTRYWMESGRKIALPVLPLRLYGLDKLSSDGERLLFLCEGPFDAIALDQHLRSNKTRTRFDILAVPSATVFNREWLKYLRDRTVRLVYDNDKAAQDGQERVAKLVGDEKVDCRLSALNWPPSYPEKCDISDLVRGGANIVEFTRDNCLKVAVGKRRLVFTRGDTIAEEAVEWMDAGHIAFGTFTSLSGRMGTHKSDIARCLAACGTAGLPMPGSRQAVAPFVVLYFTSEDSESRVRDLVRIYGGDLTRLYVHDIAKSNEPIDLLDCLGEMEAEINSRRARLVILDALNSFVGGDISTDSRARRTLSGRLQSLARRTGACTLGIRNWGRMDGGSASQKALGATSLSDVARCVMNTEELPPIEKGAPRRFQLEFEKVSDAPKPLSLPYSVTNLSTCEADSHLRKIIWEKPVDPIALKKALDALKKRSGKR